MEKELRIGNWVIYKSHVIQLCSEDFAQLEDDIKTGIFSPIPLDEAWLLDFGFERDGAYWSHRNLNLQTSELKNGGEIILVPNRKYVLELKYTHQLQNLYFALTGEELIRKQK